jgi:uncharacterized membrane protein YhhN
MMMNSLIIACAAILLGGLLYFEKGENRRGLIPVKSALSLLFVLALIVQPHPVPAYYFLLLMGLLLCLSGDIFLALPRRRMFFYGLICFLLGHLFYVIGFFSAAGINQWTWIGLMTVLVISIRVYVWLAPYLGAMKGPVVLYVMVITVMACGAWSVLGSYQLALMGRIMVFVGAMSFYLSDIFVARDRFVKKEFLNRLIGLPLYYAGQFLLAFSVGLLQ